MIDAYTVQGRLPHPLTLTGLSALPAGVVWLDLDRPEPAEEEWLERLLGIDVPTRDEIYRLEPSSRLYRENGAAYALARLVRRGEDGRGERAEVAFVLKNDLLITVRYGPSRAFGAVAAHVGPGAEVCSSGSAALAALLEAIVDRAGAILDEASAEIDALSERILSDPTGRRPRRSAADLEAALATLARLQSLVTRTRESFVSLGRAVGFFALAPEIERRPELRERLEGVGREVRALSDHASFVAGSVVFMLDAALGVINVEQNAIIKFFSVAAVVLLPPTLVASVYGMNFQFMPELGWRFGYPLALALMALSAVLPYLWFKRRGWF